MLLHFWVVVLNWTVLRAATSQPSACMTRVAIVLPTYLFIHYHQHLKPSIGRARPDSPIDDLKI